MTYQELKQREAAGLKQTLAQLVGGVIVQVEVVEEDDDNWPVLVVEGGGKILQVEILRDPEANGPGALGISDITANQG